MGWRDRKRYALRLAMRKLDRSGGYETLITRDDGVVYVMRGVGDVGALPHDLAHHVVETVLALDDGLWGSIARGAVLPTMHFRSGRRSPKAALRSRAVLQAHAASLDDAEACVELMRACAEPCLPIPAAMRRATPSAQTRAEPSQIAALRKAHAEALARWQATPAGGALELSWP